MEPRHDGQQQPQVGGQTGERGEPLLPPPAEAEGQPEAGDAEAEPATPPLPPGIDEEDLQCIICFEDYDRASRLPILLPCDHRCCKECFDKLTLERRSRWRYAENRGVTVPCPLCRREASQREVRMDLLLLSVIVAPNSPQAVDFRRSRTNSADGLIEGRASAQGTGTTLSENVMLCAAILWVLQFSLQAIPSVYLIYKAIAASDLPAWTKEEYDSECGSAEGAQYSPLLYDPSSRFPSWAWFYVDIPLFVGAVFVCSGTLLFSMRKASENRWPLLRCANGVLWAATARQVGLLFLLLPLMMRPLKEGDRDLPSQFSSDSFFSQDIKCARLAFIEGTLIVLVGGLRGILWCFNALARVVGGTLGSCCVWLGAAGSYEGSGNCCDNCGAVCNRCFGGCCNASTVCWCLPVRFLGPVSAVLGLLGFLVGFVAQWGEPFFVGVPLLASDLIGIALLYVVSVTSLSSGPPSGNGDVERAVSDNRAQGPVQNGNRQG